MANLRSILGQLSGARGGAAPTAGGRRSMGRGTAGRGAAGKAAGRAAGRAAAGRRTTAGTGRRGAGQDPAVRGLKKLLGGRVR